MHTSSDVDLTYYVYFLTRHITYHIRETSFLRLPNVVSKVIALSAPGILNTKYVDEPFNPLERNLVSYFEEKNHIFLLEKRKCAHSEWSSKRKPLAFFLGVVNTYKYSFSTHFFTTDFNN